MKCAICNIETHGNDVRWGPEFAHEICIEVYRIGFNVGKHTLQELLLRTIPMLSGAGSGTLAAEILRVIEDA